MGNNKRKRRGASSRQETPKPHLHPATHQDPKNMLQTQQDAEDLQQIENPSLISVLKAEQLVPPTIQNSTPIDVEDESQIHKPNSIHEDNHLKVQNPISVEDDEDYVNIFKPDHEKKESLEPQQSQGGDLEGDFGKKSDHKNEEEERQLERITEEEKQMEPESTKFSAPDEGNVSRKALKRKMNTGKRSDFERETKLVQNPISIDDDAEDLKEIESTDLVEDKKGFMVVEEEKGDLLEIENNNVIEEQKPQSQLELHLKQSEKDDLEGEMVPESDTHNEDEGQKEEQSEEEKQIEQEEPQGMDLSPPLHTPPVDEGVMLGLVLDIQPTAPNVSRKAPKKKKLNVKRQAALEKRLERVKQILQPIPFVPEKSLEFSKHEELFKRLGLWEFVNMKFDQDIRSDLLAQLIANYTPKSSCSHVNNIRIKVSRADLARALKLPVKKEKSMSMETSDFDLETLSEESRSFIDEFLSNWILLHEDTWILPKEVLNWNAVIKNGEPHKVDWAKVIWFMVEKELTQAHQMGTLYYASHMQCLMKSQREDIFKDEPRLEDPMNAEDVGVDLTIGSAEDNQGREVGKQQIELCLGQNKDESEQLYREEDVMDYQEGKQEVGGLPAWLLDGRSSMHDLSLRHCNLNDAQNSEGQDPIKEKDEEGYDPQSKCPNVGGLSSTGLFQGIGAANVTYSPSFRLPAQSVGDIFQSGVDMHLNTGEPSMFPNSYNRDYTDDDFADHHTLSGHHKRTRNDVSSDFDLVMEQINKLTRKARVMYEEKASVNVSMNEELVASIQQENESLVENLQKAQWELQRKEKLIYNLEHELHLMADLLAGYRKAMKASQQALSEYRERHPEPEESLYKDVGPNGLVLSTMEIERRRLQQEAEEKMQRHTVEQMLDAFQNRWLEELEAHDNSVNHLNERLLELEMEVKFFKERHANTKMTENVADEVSILKGIQCIVVSAWLPHIGQFASTGYNRCVSQDFVGRAP